MYAVPVELGKRQQARGFVQSDSLKDAGSWLGLIIGTDLV